MKKVLVVCLIAMFCSSCYTVKWTVGDGPQSGVVLKEKNHFVINGLVPVGTSDPAAMAGNSEDYQVEITHSFVDGLLSAITFGIYTPTTTIVRK